MVRARGFRARASPNLAADRSSTPAEKRDPARVDRFDSLGCRMQICADDTRPTVLCERRRRRKLPRAAACARKVPAVPRSGVSNSAARKAERVSPSSLQTRFRSPQRALKRSATCGVQTGTMKCEIRPIRGRGTSREAAGWPHPTLTWCGESAPARNRAGGASRRQSTERTAVARATNARVCAHVRLPFRTAACSGTRELSQSSSPCSAPAFSHPLFTSSHSRPICPKSGQFDRLVVQATSRSSSGRSSEKEGGREEKEPGHDSIETSPGTNGKKGRRAISS